MADPFAAALAALHASALAVDGSYTFKGTATPIPVRAIVSAPDEVAGTARGGSVNADIPVAQLAALGAPAKGDTLVLAARTLIVETVRADDGRITYAFGMSEARP